MRNFIKQTTPIRRQRGRGDIDAERERPPNLRYVYALTAFVSLGAFLFGWDQGVMTMIIADERWLALMQPANEWSVGFVISIYNIGCVLGALTVGWFADVCGRERTLSLASGIFIVGALLQAGAGSIGQISTGRAVLGLGVGAYSAGVPLYISEIAPPRLRGRVVGIELMILCAGEMVVFWVVYACYRLAAPGDRGWWRLPLAVQVLPAAVLALGCCAGGYVPPSPRWLVAQARPDCAREVLARLHGDAAADAEMREIAARVDRRDAAASAAHHHHGTAAATACSWADMFRGPARRVTLLGMGVQALQQLTGTNGLFYYTPLLFRRGGIADPNAANLATGGVGVVLFASAWAPVLWFDRLGRKTWLQLGLLGMLAALAGIVALQALRPEGPWRYVIILFPYLFFTSFNMSWSSGSWTYAAEIFPISMRAKGNALCTASLWISNFVVAQVSPPIESATGYGLYVMFAVICVFAFFFVRYALVETKGRTLEEMAELFGLDGHGKEQDPEDSATQGLLQPDARDDD
ncbi:permease of the major facilitator superfamily [Xylariomycetidae sp. FL0641]|nr:permease of the major facilitator superfamily [Xylariomycetidae sp. FL0641]